MDYFSYGIEDFIPCEVCSSRAVDIHHIIPRSHFGKKRVNDRDSIDNLIALCRSCHNKAHDEILKRKDLFFIHKQKMDGFKR